MCIVWSIHGLVAAEAICLVEGHRHAVVVQRQAVLKQAIQRGLQQRRGDMDDDG